VFEATRTAARDHTEEILAMPIEAS